MSRKLIDEFYWSDIEEHKGEQLTDDEKYKRIVSWAGKARGQNPGVFDALTEIWIYQLLEGLRCRGTVGAVYA